MLGFRNLKGDLNLKNKNQKEESLPREMGWDEDGEMSKRRMAVEDEKEQVVAKFKPRVEIVAHVMCVMSIVTNASHWTPSCADRSIHSSARLLIDFDIRHQRLYAAHYHNSFISSESE